MYSESVAGSEAVPSIQGHCAEFAEILFTHALWSLKHSMYNMTLYHLALLAAVVSTTTVTSHSFTMCFHAIQCSY